MNARNTISNFHRTNEANLKPVFSRPDFHSSPYWAELKRQTSREMEEIRLTPVGMVRESDMAFRFRVRDLQPQHTSVCIMLG